MMLMQKKLDQKKSKAEKNKQMQALVEEQDYDSIKDKLSRNLGAIFGQDSDGQSSENELLRKLREWKKRRQDLRN